MDGVTLDVNLQLQTQLLANENGNAAGSGWSADVFVRRTRLLVNGDIGKHLSYLVQLDDANFGKYCNTSGRTIVMDAWVGWAPDGHQRPERPLHRRRHPAHPDLAPP